jgi:hypothetical protein
MASRNAKAVDIGNDGPHRPTERPVVDSDCLDRFIFGRGGASVDPAFEQRDFGRRERRLILGRHTRDIVDAAHRFDQTAGGRLPWHDGRPAIAALPSELGGI